MASLELMWIIKIGKPLVEISETYKEAVIKLSDISDGCVPEDIKVLMLLLQKVNQLVEDVNNFAKDYIKNAASAGIIDKTRQQFDDAARSFKEAVTRVLGSRSFIEEAHDPAILRWLLGSNLSYDSGRHAATLHKKLFDEMIEVQKHMKGLPTIRSFQSLDIPESALGLTQHPSREKYAYPALPTLTSIRLVRMVSRSIEFSSGIEISLETVDLKHHPSYSALSYTWGKPCGIFRSREEATATVYDNIPITCNGKILLIGENLYRFLYRWQQALSACEVGLDLNMSSEEEKSHHPPSHFWIDAICINQMDNNEKSSQVSMMGDIYAASHNAWVWLGDEDAFSRTALETIYLLCQTSIKFSEGKTNAETVQELRKFDDLGTAFEALGLPMYESNTWEWICVFAFLNRHWFRRSWIVQEACLAPNIHIFNGSLTCEWTVLTTAVSLMATLGILDWVSTLAESEMDFTVPWRVCHSVNKDGSGFVLEKAQREPLDAYIYADPGLDDWSLAIGTVLLSIIRARETTQLVPYMSDLWALSRMTRCHDPADKVYAYVQLAHRDCYKYAHTHRQRRKIIPDYSLSVRQIYIEATWFALLTDQDLNYLSQARSASNFHDLPSWVPDLSVAPGINSLRQFADSKPHSLNWSASGSKKWRPLPFPLLYLPFLCVEAVHVGIVCDVVEGLNNDPVDYSGAILCAAQLPKNYQQIAGGQSPLEVLWRTLVVDFYQKAHPASANCGDEFKSAVIIDISNTMKETVFGTTGDLDRYERYIDAICSTHIASDVPRDIRQLEIAGEKVRTDFQQRLLEMTRNRKLFRSDSGHLGIADERIALGDQIVILGGADIPFILRPSTKNNRKILVGEAYVHGIMHGEMAERDDVVWEQVILD